MGISVVGLDRSNPFVIDLSQVDARVPTRDNSPVQKDRVQTQAIEGPQGDDLCALRRTGDFWEVSYEGRSFSIRHLAGLNYLAPLLATPFREFRAEELDALIRGHAAVSQTEPVELFLAATNHDSGVETQLLDDTALAEYHARLRALEARAEEDLDGGERRELDWLGTTLRKDTRLGGSSRTTAGTVMRIRNNTTKRIHKALNAIDKQDAALAQFLRNSIQTGSACQYAPDRPIRWAVSGTAIR